MKMLTKLKLDSLSVPGDYAVGGVVGLWVQVTLGKYDKVNRSFVYKYAINRRSREMGMGSCSTVSLAQARESARAAAALKARGLDPLEERAKAKAEAAIRHITFAEAAEAFLRHLEAQRKGTRFPLTTARQWRSTLDRFVLKKIGRLDTRDIRHAHIAAILAPLSLVREANRRKALGGPTIASRLRSRIERILDWSAVHGYRDVDAVNPARPELFKDVLGSAPKTQHFRAAPLAEVPAIYQKVAAETEPVFCAIRFLILTTARLREVLDCEWPEFDLDARLWRVGAARSKTGVELIIPLSGAAMEVIEAQAASRSSARWIFPGRYDRPLASSTIGPALRRLGIVSTVPHGFRSSWSDWCSELGGVPNDVREHQLGHLVGSAVEQAYRRMSSLAARRVALDRYADWLAGKIEATDNIVAFKATA
jgi:integrase